MTAGSQGRPDVPPALAARPWDERRHLPIPVVAEFEGEVNFAAINSEVALEMARQRMCGLCGQEMGYWVAFLGGPKSAEQGTYGDPPMHPDCAEAAVLLCPHIALSHHRRVSDARQAQLAAGHPVTVHEGWVEDKPDEWVMYITRQYEIDMRPAAGGGVAPVYIARPSKTRRRFTYDEEGRIREQR